MGVCIIANSEGGMMIALPLLPLIGLLSPWFAVR
jgi:hypothetical protein